MSSTPGVAVVITCYNEGSYIGAAVRSVLSQTRNELIQSIVIADDGSRAETIAVLRDIEKWDKRITVVYGNGSAGLPAQRNLAIRHTAAEVIAILDGDDIWMPEKIELQYVKLMQCPEVVLVYSGYRTFTGNDQGSASPAKVIDITRASDVTLQYFLHDPPIIPSTTLFRRSAYDSCGGYDASLRVFEDSDFHLRISRVGSFAFVPERLLNKRIRGDSITGGRRDLMAYHAFVALKAAVDEPRLLPRVPRRLAERARKLGNQRFLAGAVEEAHGLLGLALRLHPWNPRTWMSFIATTKCLSGSALRILASRAHTKRLMEFAKPCR